MLFYIDKTWSVILYCQKVMISLSFISFLFGYEINVVEMAIFLCMGSPTNGKTLQISQLWWDSPPKIFLLELNKLKNFNKLRIIIGIKAEHVLLIPIKLFVIYLKSHFVFII